MENRNFIESGVLENHALGFSTDDEKEYIKQRILKDPEVSDHISEIEKDIRQFFDNSSVSPPTEVREIIQLRSTQIDIKKEQHKSNRATKEKSQKNDQYLDIEVNDTHIKVHKYWRPAFIAVFVLSKIFLIAGLYYYFKTTNLEQEIVRLKTEINTKK